MNCVSDAFNLSGFHLMPSLLTGLPCFVMRMVSPALSILFDTAAFVIEELDDCGVPVEPFLFGNFLLTVCPVYCDIGESFSFGAICSNFRFENRLFLAIGSFSFLVLGIGSSLAFDLQLLSN